MLVKKAIATLKSRLRNIFDCDIIIYDSEGSKIENECATYLIIKNVEDFNANIKEPSKENILYENAYSFEIKGRIFRKFNSNLETLLDKLLSKNEKSYYFYSKLPSKIELVECDIEEHICFEQYMGLENDLYTYLDFTYLTSALTLSNNLECNKNKIKEVEINVDSRY